VAIIPAPILIFTVKESDQPLILLQPSLVRLGFKSRFGVAADNDFTSKRLAGRRLDDFDGGTQKIYQEMIEALDLQVGRVVAAIQADGLSENTIIVFTSDNGGERFADTWPFTGRKTELLEGGLRIPAILSWPARIPGGRTTNQVAISMDWLPTLLAAAGVSPDPAYPPDGINLLPVLGTKAAPIERKLFWRYKGNAQRAVRDGDYKFLKILDNTFLFNEVDDPMERANLKERYKDIYDRLIRDWLAWNATMPPEIDESFTDTRQLLQALRSATRWGPARIRRPRFRANNPTPCRSRVTSKLPLGDSGSVLPFSRARNLPSAPRAACGMGWVPEWFM
jgi:hypothetical protein